MKIRLYVCIFLLSNVLLGCGSETMNEPKEDVFQNTDIIVDDTDINDEVIKINELTVDEVALQIAKDFVSEYGFNNTVESYGFDDPESSEFSKYVVLRINSSYKMSEVGSFMKSLSIEEYQQAYNDTVVEVNSIIEGLINKIGSDYTGGILVIMNLYNDEPDFTSTANTVIASSSYDGYEKYFNDAFKIKAKSRGININYLD